MLSIIICEDDKKQRERLEKTIADYVMIEAINMKIALSTDNPDVLLDYLEKNPKTTGLYFLDVDLQHKMNGITLASKIRKRDVLGKIVFVTTHGELSYLTFIHKVEAMDYVIKDGSENIRNRVQSCIDVAYERYLDDKHPDKKTYTIKVGDQMLNFPYEDIMFIESAETPHKLVLHLENGQLEYYGTLRDVEEVNPDFYRCHKSVIVNPKKIKEVDKSTKEAEMINGEYCLISARAMKGLMQIMVTK